MKMALKYSTLLLVTALAAPVALAQQESSQSSSQSQTSQTSSQAGQSQYLRFSQLHNGKIQSAQGDNLGTIEELVVDQKGKIHFAVLGVGGFLGIGQKMTPVPWNLISASGQDQFVLNAEKSKLQSAPTLDKDQWTQLNNPQWINQVYSHYGVQMPEAVGGTGSSQFGTESGTQKDYNKSDSDLNKDKDDDDTLK